jgi:hypothetical protein
MTTLARKGTSFLPSSFRQYGLLYVLNLVILNNSLRMTVNQHVSTPHQPRNGNARLFSRFHRQRSWHSFGGDNWDVNVAAPDYHFRGLPARGSRYSLTKVDVMQ